MITSNHILTRQMSHKTESLIVVMGDDNEEAGKPGTHPFPALIIRVLTRGCGVGRMGGEC